MQSLKTLANVLFPLSNPFLLEEGARHADGLLPWCRALSVQQGVSDFPLFVDDKDSEAAIHFYLSLHLLLTQDHRCFYLPTEKPTLVGVEPWAVFDLQAISFTSDLELRSAIVSLRSCLAITVWVWVKIAHPEILSLGGPCACGPI